MANPAHQSNGDSRFGSSSPVKKPHVTNAPERWIGHLPTLTAIPGGQQDAMSVTGPFVIAGNPADAV